jgi:uncharacterized protein DUF6527
MSLVRLSGNGTAAGSGLWLWCPGCEDSHRIVVGTSDSWSWDGNEAAPTIAPSILVYSHKTFDADRNVVDTPQCHSFVRAGQWEFLADCTHALAGQTVPMVPLPDWLNEEYAGTP